MTVLIAGPQVILRDRLPSDADRYVHWLTHGEWLEYDAPWEDTCTSLTEERKEELKQGFIESCDGEQPSPRTQAVIATHDNRPLGWVNTYSRESHPGGLFVGIDICEDEYLNQGVGTEALRLWIDYLFANTDLHRIGLETWSFNRRMIRVAEKVGFVCVCIQCESMEWQGEWLDLYHFCLLRSEWRAEGPALPLRRGRE